MARYLLRICGTDRRAHFCRIHGFADQIGTVVQIMNGKHSWNSLSVEVRNWSRLPIMTMQDIRTTRRIIQQIMKRHRTEGSEAMIIFVHVHIYLSSPEYTVAWLQECRVQPFHTSMPHLDLCSIAPEVSGQLQILHLHNYHESRTSVRILRIHRR